MAGLRPEVAMRAPNSPVGAPAPQALRGRCVDAVWVAREAGAPQAPRLGAWPQVLHGLVLRWRTPREAVQCGEPTLVEPEGG